MFYNVQKVKDITDTKEKFFTRKVLMEHDNSSLSVVAIKKGEIIRKVPEEQLLDTLREELLHWES